MLRMVKTTRTAWYSVLADLMGHGASSPKNGNEAKAAFYHYMGWDSANVKDVGKVSGAGDIVVDQSFQDRHCTSIVEVVKEHESAHFWYFTLRAIPIFMMSQRSIAMVLARSEIDSRNVQARYLSNAIKALKKKCGRDYSADDDGPSMGSGSGNRIQDMPPN